MESLKAMKDIGTKSLEIGTDLENYIYLKKKKKLYRQSLGHLLAPDVFILFTYFFTYS